ncbi:hypothetical protein GCM10023310_59910 [Paenibacillus vulneris]
MSSQFSVAHLTPEVLTQIQQLENKLRTDVNENIVLIAYSDHDSGNPKPASNPNP